jgi:hypothetical protein
MSCVEKERVMCDVRVTARRNGLALKTATVKARSSRQAVGYKAVKLRLRKQDVGVLG